MAQAEPAFGPVDSAAGFPPRTPSRPHEAILAAALILGAAALRWVRWERTGMLFNDGPHFLAMAGRMARDEWAWALAHDYHPLYPFLTLLAHLAGLALEPAAVLVSVLAGAAAVGLLYGFVRDAFGWPAAPLAALLLAVHPRVVNASSDVQSEGVYLAALIGALWLAWRSLERRSWPLAAWAGAVSALAYLTRPEGMGAVITAGMTVLVLLWRREWRFREALAWGAAAALGVLLVAGPYLTVLRVQNGAWTPTAKKSVTLMAGFETTMRLRAAPGGLEAGMRLPAARPRNDEALPVAPPRPRSVPAAVLDLLDRFLSGARLEIVLLLALGLWSVRGRPGMRGSFFLCGVGLHGLVLLGLAYNVGYVSSRHVLPVVVPLLGYAALGVPQLGGALLRGLRRPATPGLALGLGLALPLLASAVELAPPRRADDLAKRQAAEWLRTLEPRAVAATRGRVAYYAGAPHVPVEPHLSVLHAEVLREAGASHLILSRDALGEEDWQVLVARPGLRRLERFEARGEEAVVFAVEPEAGAETGTSPDPGPSQSPSKSSSSEGS